MKAKGMNKQIIQAGEYYGGIIDAQMVKDRQYFEDHPEETMFVRDYVEGEMWPEVAPAGSLVQVTYLAPGVRIRKVLSEPYILMSKN